MIKPIALRTHEKMKEVLMDPNSPGPEIHYYMIRGGSDKTNITVWEAGTVGGEFIKAYGHYHVGKLDETYTILQGEGILLLQKRKEDKDGNPLNDEIEDFYAVKVKAGDKTFIPSGIGHLLVNTGSIWLVASDDSPVNFTEVDPVSLPGHADYESVKVMQGFAYYVVSENDSIKFVKNPRYKIVGDAKELTAEEYKNLI